MKKPDTDSEEFNRNKIQVWWYGVIYPTDEQVDTLVNNYPLVYKVEKKIKDQIILGAKKPVWDYTQAQVEIAQKEWTRIFMKIKSNFGLLIRKAWQKLLNKYGLKKTIDQE